MTACDHTSTTPLPNHNRGKLIIFSAPSGSGKSTIVQWLIHEHPEFNLSFSISCTSRQPRGAERDGIEYFFLTPEAFKEKIRSEEHTSELQSRQYLVCRLLLEKKKK